MDKRRMLVILAVAIAAGAALFRAARPAAPSASSLAEPVLAASPAPAHLVVYVVGRVARPGVYRLPAGARKEAALHAAGGPAAGADPVAVNLAEALHDGEEVVVPAIGEEPAGGTRAACAAPYRRTPRSGSRYSRQRAGRALKPAPVAPVDVNHADAAQLESLPGIGPRLAQRIVAFRDQNGFFGDAQEMLDVNGLSESELRQIEPYVVFGKR
jgi:competence protein ComEA